ncbi:NUDIX domain-containing protein [bacterium]|nr:NUDIX domain-containing protein [bacterium]
MKLGVNVAIIQDNRILLTQREDFEVWCLPGGAVDPGETLAEAARREVREEIGIEVELERLVGVYSLPEDGVGSGHIAVFAARPLSEELTLDPNEVIAAGYFTLDTLPDAMLDWHRPRAEDALSGVGGSLYRRQNVPWPFPQLSRRELYALRDRLGLPRAEFYHRFYVAGETVPAAVLPVRTFLLDADHLLANKRRLAARDATLEHAYANLLVEAEDALNAGPWSVMDKPHTPPSGDKHDYYSVGPYWWPNPDSADGLPYVRRDGETNPERAHYDSDPLKDLIAAVDTLALAYFFSEDERFARHAAHLLRVWFLDEATRMNPHLNYGQAIPGICDGRGIGIIDTLQLSRTVDAIGLLAASPHWEKTDQLGMADWFRRYTDWLLQSPLGQEEARQHNNHGVWYDAQVAAFALFAGMKEIARALLVTSAPQRITAHIAQDGSQPHELARTRSLSYSVMNLHGLMDLARLGDHFDLDLWRFVGRDHGGIQAALDYLIANTVDADWDLPQITPFDQNELLSLLLRAVAVYPETEYAAVALRLQAEESAADRAGSFEYTQNRTRIERIERISADFLRF